MRLPVSRLRINVLSGSLTALLRAGITLVAYPIFLHRLGYEAYGLWLTVGTVLALAQLGNLGMSPALTKLVAQEHARGVHRNVQSYVTTTAISVIALGGIAALLILFFQSDILTAFNLQGTQYATAKALLPWVSALSVYAFLNDSLQAAVSGLGRIDIANAIQTGGRITSLALSSLLLFANVGIWSLLIGDAVSYLIVYSASAYALKVLANISIFSPRSFTFCHFLSLVHFGGGLTLTYFAGLLLVPFSKFVLSRDVGLAAVSIYEIAYNSALSLRNLIDNGLRALNPEISSIAARESSQRQSVIKRINRRAISVIIAVGIPSLGAACAMATPLMKTWLGARFTPSLPAAFRLMALGAFLSLLGTPAYYSLMGLGRIRQVVFAHGIQAFVNCLLVILVSVLNSASAFHVLLAAALAMTSTTIYLTWAFSRALADL